MSRLDEGSSMRNDMTTSRPSVLGVNGLKASIAIVFLAYPRAMVAWVGPTADAAGGQVLLRAFGIRDLTLALGAITARGALARRRWLIAGGVSDIVDAVVTLTTARRSSQELGELTTLTAVWAAGSGIACLALAATEAD
jgi:hypothetical protein